MEGARAPKFRSYWIRYIVTFWAGKKLKWARDNILVGCICSLAPGLIAAGISAALSDDKWRAVTYATLLTYTGLFTLFLTWSWPVPETSMPPGSAKASRRAAMLIPSP